MELTQFHTDDYVDFLSRITPDNIRQYPSAQSEFGIWEDCPVFDGLYEFCSISAGGSMEGAAHLNHGKCDIAINWAGGLHHAKKSKANGFCYVNGKLEVVECELLSRSSGGFVTHLFRTRHRFRDSRTPEIPQKSPVH